MRSRYTYFDTEVSIGAPDVLRFTSLEKLGIDQDKMITELIPSFWRLEPDIYDSQREKMRFLMEKAGHEACKSPQMQQRLVQFYANELKLDDFTEVAHLLSTRERDTLNAICATRRRAATAFELSLKNQSWEIAVGNLGPFVQDNVDRNDVRAVPRFFPPVCQSVTGSDCLRKFLTSIAWLTHEVSSAKKMRMVLHQIRVIADNVRAGDNAPEGRHQDNANFVVTAAILERKNITGAESIVSNSDGSRVYFSRELQVGELLFHADTPSQLWHDVTPMRPLKGCAEGSRSRFGLDIHVFA